MHTATHDADCTMYVFQCVDDYHTASCAADQMKAMIMLKESAAGAHPFTSSLIVRLLPPAPAWLLRRKKRRSEACARKHAAHHPIVDTQRHDWARVATSREKKLICKMYSLTMVMYT